MAWLWVTWRYYFTWVTALTVRSISFSFLFTIFLRRIFIFVFAGMLLLVFLSLISIFLFISSWTVFFLLFFFAMAMFFSFLTTSAPTTTPRSMLVFLLFKLSLFVLILSVISKPFYHIWKFTTIDFVSFCIYFLKLFTLSFFGSFLFF